MDQSRNTTNDIKFDASKTNYMIFNRKMSPNADEKCFEEWNEELMLDNEKIKYQD